ncbi:MAG: GAF domain-containing protein [Candidatus Rokubacteria bacterium]|nr:GAF domain-containing protein [Candidatus Rokubacteria bacterium]
MSPADVVTASPEERARLLEVLRKILQSIGSVRDEWEIFETAVRETARQLRYDWVSLVLEDLDERTARVFLSTPPGSGPLRVGEVVDHRSGFWEAMRTGRPFVRESFDLSGPLWEDPALRRLGITAYAAIPLILRGKIIGTFNVGTREAEGLSANVALMTLLAEFLANAVLAARLIAEVQQGLARLREKVASPPPPQL